jgi:DnaK suppressor protein
MSFVSASSDLAGRSQTVHTGASAGRFLSRRGVAPVICGHESWSYGFANARSSDGFDPGTAGKVRSRGQADRGNSVDERRARELLAAERARVERQLAEFAEPPGDSEVAHGDQHLADEASDLTEDELRAGRVDDLRKRLRAVERAEERLAAGTYGFSVESGLPIPDERLEVEPTAERTVAEEARQTGTR